MVSAVNDSVVPPITVKGIVEVTNVWSGLDETAVMAAVPWPTDVTNPGDITPVVGHTTPVVQTVATAVLLEYHWVVIGYDGMPLVTSCVVGADENVPIASSWLVRPGDASD